MKGARTKGDKRSLRAVLLLLLLALSFLLPYNATAQENVASTIQARDWWDSDWRFRKTLVVANNLELAQQEIPIFFFLEVERGSMTNALKELRVVRDGIEIPSWIIYQNIDDGLVVGVYLVFLLSIPARESADIALYFGNSQAETPPYRNVSSAPEVGLVDMTFDSVNQEFLIAFSNQYQHSLSFMVKDAFDTFGSTPFNSSRFFIQSEWTPIGDLSTTSLTANRIILRAESLLIVITGVWNQESIWLSSLIINNQETSTGLVSLTSVLDFSGLDEIGSVESFYDIRNDIFRLGAAGSWFGVTSSIPPRLFDIAPATQAHGIALSGNYQGRSNAQNNVSLVTRVDLALLSPGKHIEHLWFWQVSPTMEDTLTSLSKLRDGISTISLSLEIPDTPIPSGSMLYRSHIRFPNQSLPLDFEIALASDGSQIIPTWHQSSGLGSFSVPDLDASSFTPGSDFWTEEEERNSGISYSSSSHLTAERGSIGRLYVAVPLGEGNAAATLTSLRVAVDDMISASIGFSFLTSYSEDSIASGQLSLNIDYEGNSSADRSIVWPILGLNQTQERYKEETSSVYDRLAPSGKWSSILTDLTADIPDHSSIWIEAQLNSTRGYVELNLDDIVLRFTGDLPSILRVQPTESGFDFEWNGPDYARDLSAEIDLEFQVLQDSQFNAEDGPRFSAQFETPELEYVGLLEADKISTVPYQALIYISRPSTVESVSINGQRLEAGSAVRVSGLLLVDRGELAGNSHSLSVEFVFGILNVETSDAGGFEASGVIVVLRDAFGRLVARGESGVDGRTSFRLAPSEYQIELFFHNKSLGSRTALIRSDVTVRAEMPIFQLRLRVLDRLGSPLENATISLLTEESQVGRAVTGASGQAVFQLLGDTEYRVLVERSGILVRDTIIRANIYGTTLVIGTDIVPSWVNLVVIIILILAVVFLLIYFKIGR